MLSRKTENASFESTAIPHLDSVYRFARHLCGNESDAEDLTQECFHLAYRKFHQFEAGTNCKAWLFRIVRNAYVDRLRRKSREPRTSELTDNLVSTADPESESSRKMWQDLARNGTQPPLEIFGDEINRHLNELPTEFRLAVILCDVEHFSYSEIGELLGCPVGTVRSRISRARNYLKEKLYDYARDLGYVKSEDE